MHVHHIAMYEYLSACPHLKFTSGTPAVSHKHVCKQSCFVCDNYSAGEEVMRRHVWAWLPCTSVLMQCHGSERWEAVMESQLLHNSYLPPYEIHFNLETHNKSTWHPHTGYTLTLKISFPFSVHYFSCSPGSQTGVQMCWGFHTYSHSKNSCISLHSFHWLCKLLTVF